MTYAYSKKGGDNMKSGDDNVNLNNILTSVVKGVSAGTIIGILIVIIILVVAIFNVFGNKNRDTVDMNDTLTIKQSAADYDFSIKVNSVKVNQTVAADFSKSTYAIVNLTMKLNSGKVPNPILYGYILIDSNGNELARATSLSAPVVVDTNMLFNERKLESTKTTTGDLYFETSSSDVQKLKIYVATNGIASTDNDIEYYYIDLK